MAEDTWIMRGLEWDDPLRIRTWQELISLAWLPHFANYRRDGYDFDARWEDGLASRREKAIMDQVTSKDRDGDTSFPDIRMCLQWMYLPVE